jgi:hypothetical protein
MAAIGAGAIGAGAIRAVIDEAALNQLVRGQSATLVAHPGEQPVELILRGGPERLHGKPTGRRATGGGDMSLAATRTLDGDLFPPQRLFRERLRRRVELRERVP